MTTCKDPEMLDEYDFSNGIRCKYADRFHREEQQPQRQGPDRQLERNQGKPMDSSLLLERITIDPAICHGKPCVRNLRYPVEMLLELLAAGMTHEELLEDYEDLEQEDLLAVLAYAARLSQVKRVQPILA